MIHHIIFHSDIDGIFTAALYLRAKAQLENYRLYPVMSYHRGERFNNMIRSIVNNSKAKDSEFAILDFENHEMSTLWVDHHYSFQLGEQPISTNRLIYDPSSKSAFNLMATHFKVDDELAPVIAQVNMVDSADYKDVNFVFHDISPVMILRAYLEKEYPNDMIFSRIVEILAHTGFNLQEAIAILGLGPQVIDAMRGNVIKAKQFLEVYHKISVIRQRRINEYPRYSESFIRPDVKYNVRLSPSGKKNWQVQASFNRWHVENNEVNIGRFIASLPYVNGGGHHNVGGGTIKEEDFDAFLADFSSVTKNEESQMEKYGVDQQEDKVEKKAQDMVKTGEESNLNDARKKAIKEDGDGADKITDSNK